MPQVFSGSQIAPVQRNPGISLQTCSGFGLLLLDRGAALYVHLHREIKAFLLEGAVYVPLPSTIRIRPIPS